MKIDPRHQFTPHNLQREANKMKELCRMVNSDAEKLGLGQKVRAEDWTEELRAMAEIARKEAHRDNSMA